MNFKKVFITREILSPGIKLLQDHGFIVDVYKGQGPIDKETLYQKARQTDALITMLSDSIDKDFIETNFHLKIIANYAVGFNNIDISTAKRLNILVTNTPDVLTEATAEIALGLMIMASRSFHSAHLELIEHKFKSFDPCGFLGHALSGKTLGIIGMGRIGSNLALKAKSAFNMEIVYTSKNSIAPFGKKLSLDELLKVSDVISLHTPLTTETKQLISHREFGLMKKKAIFINTSRGDVVDQDALVTALRENTLFGAGLDVTTPEPLPEDHPLLNLRNVFILPHIGSATYEARGEMSLLCAQNIIDSSNGLRPKTLVN